MTLKRQIKELINQGVYGYHELFNRIYPNYNGHYYTLRKAIAEVKNGY